MEDGFGCFIVIVMILFLLFGGISSLNSEIGVRKNEFLQNALNACRNGKTFECGVMYNKSQYKAEKEVMRFAYKTKTGKELTKEILK